jgi:hypothetical protein
MVKLLNMAQVKYAKIKIPALFLSSPSAGKSIYQPPTSSCWGRFPRRRAVGYAKEALTKV